MDFFIMGYISFDCLCFHPLNDVSISIKITLKFVIKGQIYNVPALVQVMAWRRPGANTLSEPMSVSSLTHWCITSMG